ncbi:MAG: hypothetical protein ACMXYK_03325 [Candidatus Woesearchaeota archaeon]
MKNRFAVLTALYTQFAVQQKVSQDLEILEHNTLLPTIGAEIEVYYSITEKSWITWIEKIFWNMWMT